MPAVSVDVNTVSEKGHFFASSFTWKFFPPVDRPVSTFKESDFPGAVERPLDILETNDGFEYLEMTQLSSQYWQ